MSLKSLCNLVSDYIRPSSRCNDRPIYNPDSDVGLMVARNWCRLTQLLYMKCAQSCVALPVTLNHCDSAQA